jgi:hypothetical protein
MASASTLRWSHDPRRSKCAIVGGGDRFGQSATSWAEMPDEAVKRDDLTVSTKASPASRPFRETKWELGGDGIDRAAVSRMVRERGSCS